MASLRRWALLFTAALAISGCSATDDRVSVAAPESGEEPYVSQSLGGDDDRSSGFRDPMTGLLIVPTSFHALPGWRSDDLSGVVDAMRRSCSAIQASGDTRRLGSVRIDATEWRRLCGQLLRIRPEQARGYLETNFAPVRIGPASRGLMTAYFEPVLEARRRPDQRFRYPIYAPPPELKRQGGAYGVATGAGLRPHFSRGEIDAGALQGRRLEIAWLNDPIDLFFLHIQGSGSLRFADGSTTRVGFAGKNGHAYRSVGREMIARGWARGGDASPEAIRALYRANPGRGRELLAFNKSYIFFREIRDLDPGSGPVGALGAQLTAGRSIAVDRDFAPLGAPVWIDAPASPIGPIRRLAVAQDTGSAIKGAQRIDLFMGSGARAGEIAGGFSHPVRVTVLLPKTTLARMRANAN